MAPTEQTTTGEGTQPFQVLWLNINGINSNKADSARFNRVKPDAVLVSTALKLFALAFKVLASDSDAASLPPSTLKPVATLDIES